MRFEEIQKWPITGKTISRVQIFKISSLGPSYRDGHLHQAYPGLYYPLGLLTLKFVYMGLNILY